MLNMGVCMILLSLKKSHILRGLLDKNSQCGEPQIMAYIHAFPCLSAEVWDDFVSASNYTNCIDISELIFS